MTLHQQIAALVSQFASDLEALVRSAAVAAVQDALGAPTASRTATARLPKAKVHKTVQKPASRPAKASTTPPAKAIRPAKAARVRRSPEQLEATAGRIVAHVAAHPGQGAEEIKKALGLTSATWGGPVRLALESKRIRSTGVKRSTRYMPPGAVPPIKREKR